MESKFILHSTPIGDLKEIIREVVTGVLKDNSKVSAADSNKLYTRQEVADLLGLSLPTVHTYTQEGIIKGYRLGTQIRYKHSDVEKALKEIEVIKYSHKRK